MVGEVVSWTIDVGNAGNAAVSNVTVTDPLAPNVAPVLVGGFNSGDTDADTLLDVGRDLALHGEPHGDAGRA